MMDFEAKAKEIVQSLDADWSYDYLPSDVKGSAEAKKRRKAEAAKIIAIALKQVADDVRGVQ